MNKDYSGVFTHFEKIADAFDTIYKGKQKSILYKMIDVLFRKDILRRRLEAVLEFSGDISAKDILDIGCGSGRYDVLLAGYGPKSILAIDASSSMIEMAEKLADLNKVGPVCKFEKADFLEKKFGRKFDIVIASGVFDYVGDPKKFLLRIKDVLRAKAVISFPVRWNLFTPARILWLRKRGCPNYYYTEKDIRILFKNCGLKVDSIRKIGSFLVPGNYIVAACA